MASTITDRVNGVVSGVAVVNGSGIISTSNVAGVDAITADTTPTISGYLNPSLYFLRPANANTGPVDANLGGGGMVSVLKPNGDELAAGEFSPALEYLLKFNGTEFRVIAPSF